jgi:hypothetical protein
LIRNTQFALRNHRFNGSCMTIQVNECAYMKTRSMTRPAKHFSPRQAHPLKKDLHFAQLGDRLPASESAYIAGYSLTERRVIGIRASVAVGDLGVLGQIHQAVGRLEQCFVLITGRRKDG